MLETPLPETVEDVSDLLEFCLIKIFTYWDANEHSC